MVALEQVHVLGGLPQGPEVLHDLGLLSKCTGKASATWLHWRKPMCSCWEKQGADPQASDQREPSHHAPRPRQLPGPPQPRWLRVWPQPGRWQRKDSTQKLVFCTPRSQWHYSQGTRRKPHRHPSLGARLNRTWSIHAMEYSPASKRKESLTPATAGMDLADLMLREIKPDTTGQTPYDST